MILKPAKGNVVKLMNKSDYRDAMKELFSDETKFKIIKNYWKLFKSLKTIKIIKLGEKQFRTLDNLHKRNEITEAEEKQMRPMSAQLGRTHDLPKVHKVFTNITKFRPVIDSTIRSYYKIGKYLPSVLQLLTINNYTLNNSIEEVNEITSIPSDCLKKDITLRHLTLCLYSRMCRSIKPSILV